MSTSGFQADLLLLDKDNRFLRIQDIASFVKDDEGSNTGHRMIKFEMATGNVLFWDYTDEEARDADFAIIEKVLTTVTI